MNDFMEIWDGIYVNPDSNARDARLKIRDCIRQAQSECKGEELSEISMGKIVHKVFKYV